MYLHDHHLDFLAFRFEKRVQRCFGRIECPGKMPNLISFDLSLRHRIAGPV